MTISDEDKLAQVRQQLAPLMQQGNPCDDDKIKRLLREAVEITTSDVDKLAQLLQQLAQLMQQENPRDDDKITRLQREAVEIIYRHLYAALRPYFVARYPETATGKHARSLRICCTIFSFTFWRSFPIS